MSTKSVNFAEYQVGIRLIITDEASMTSHHEITYSGINVSGFPLDSLVYWLETDDPASMRDLNLAVYGKNNDDLRYTINTYLPAKKLITAFFKKPVEDGESFLCTISYDAPERDRYFQYYCSERNQRLKFDFDFPDSMRRPMDSFKTPFAVKLRGKDILDPEPIFPSIEKSGAKSVATWSFDDAGFGFIYRIQW